MRVFLRVYVCVCVCVYFSRYTTDNNRQINKRFSNNLGLNPDPDVYSVTDGCTNHPVHTHTHTHARTPVNSHTHAHTSTDTSSIPSPTSR